MFDASTGNSWLLTKADGTQAVSLVQILTDGSTKSFHVSDNGGSSSGLFLAPAGAGPVWVGWGSHLERVDPRDGQQLDIKVPIGPHDPGTDIPGFIQAGATDGTVVYLARLGSQNLLRYSVQQATWLDPIDLPLRINQKSQVVLALGQLYITGGSPKGGSDAQQVATVTNQGLASPSTIDVTGGIAGSSNGSLFSIDAKGDVRVETSPGQVHTYNAVIPPDELVPGRPWTSDTAGNVWSWVRSAGDTLIRLSETGEVTPYVFPAQILTSGDFQRKLSPSPDTTTVADPDMQSIAPTPTGVFITTRAGTGTATTWIYKSVYLLRPQ